jgi:hypothetical protein
MRFTIDPWDVTYGVSVDTETLEPTTADVALALELPAEAWRPIDPDPTLRPETILFVDGVRRVDARIWIDEGDTADPGICATYAAGAVCCDEEAHIKAVVVERGLFSASPAASDVATRHGKYPARMASSGTPEALTLALQERMLAVELRIAEQAREETTVGLLVVDGPLRGRQHLPDAVGFIKTHNVTYLPSELNETVNQLKPGQRTPVFTIGTSWSRHSWYISLPGPSGGPWAGIVRCECSADLSPTSAVSLANATNAALPRFASQPHKDPRAPQNLYPIGGLERELRRRLGDQQLMYRALRRAAALDSA